MRLIKTILLLLLWSFAPYTSGQNISPEPFFGLESKNQAQMLLPGIVSSVAWETNGNFSPDGKTFLYATNFLYSGTVIVMMNLENDAWSEPEIASFSGEYPDIDPIFSTDGKRVYFTSRRPLDEKSSDKRDTNLWYVNFTDGDFSHPTPVSSVINTEQNQFYNSIDRRHTIFFHSRDDVSNDIYMAVKENNEYVVQKLDTTINGSSSEADPYISPDGSYLIFSSDRDGGFGGSDLYISFNVNNEWSEPLNLGKNINSSSNDFAPCISGELLTFTSGRMIEPWNKEHKKDFKTLREKFQSADNQTNNIWWIHFNAEACRRDK